MLGRLNIQSGKAQTAQQRNSKRFNIERYIIVNMKYILFLLFLTIHFSFLTLCEAQEKQGQARIDSLLTQLPEAREDSNKVILLNDLGFTYNSINPDEGLKYGGLGLQLAQKLNWKKGMAAADRILGMNYTVKSDYSGALTYLINALKLSEELGNKEAIARALGNIGNVYVNLSDYSKALEYFFKALKLAEELENKNGIASLLNNIGLVYWNQMNFPKALEYFLKALRINEETGNNNGIALILGNIGLLYSDPSDFPKALEYKMKALKMYETLGDKNGISRNLGNIGTTYLYMAKNSNKPEVSKQLTKIPGGNETAILLKAKAYTDSAIVIENEIGSLKELIVNYKQLSEIKVLLGDHKGALESYTNYTVLKDSVFNMEKDKKLTQTAMQYAFDKKEAATKGEQEKKDIQQRLILYFILAGFVSMIVFSIIVYRQRNKVKIQKQVAENEKRKSDDLLLNILPNEVAEELKTTGASKAKAFTMVTVMFTDFKDFTSLSEKISAELLVDEIHYCFSAFDKIIQKYKIEKIKTIGDAYLCASGLPVSNYTHTGDMLNAAFEIRNFMLQRKEEKEDKGEIPFELRIGIHTGPVVAGIVGIKKYAYDIWGDTVNIAARMEQNSEAGKINISGSTYELVKSKFKCEHRGKIEAKNKGMIDMYFAENT